MIWLRRASLYQEDFREDVLVGRDSVEPRSERIDRRVRWGFGDNTTCKISPARSDGLNELLVPPDLFHRISHLVAPMKRRTDSKKNFQSVANFIAVIPIQFIRPMIDGELRAESDVNAIAMREIVHVAE